MKKLLTLLAALSGFFIAQNVQATCDITSSWTSGQTLTAASLNSFVTQTENCIQSILDGDVFTGNVSLHSGADLNIYSDAGSTLKASIDGATGASILGLTQEGQMTNCGISNSGTTFTIAGYDGTALSATNPCVVAVRSNIAGRLNLAYFTSNVTFTHGAASDTDGNLFGITDVNWASTMPFFIGVIYNGTTPYFTISRLPYTTSGSADTALCQKADTSCDAKLDVMIMTTGLTLSSWVDLPITQVGWFHMTYATTGGAWTAAVVDPNGFNTAYENKTFSIPTGQNGAASGKNFADNGGTAPSSTSGSLYTIFKSGLVKLDISENVIASGATAVRAKFAAPLSSSLPFIQFGIGNVSTDTLGTDITVEIEATSALVHFNDISAYAEVNNSVMVGGGSRYLIGSITYRAF